MLPVDGSLANQTMISALVITDKNVHISGGTDGYCRKSQLNPLSSRLSSCSCGLLLPWAQTIKLSTVIHLWSSL